MVTVLMPFLYFPEDKSEYIPAAISFAFFMILLVLTFMWIKRNSKKQELETKELEERITRERREAREQAKLQEQQQQQASESQNSTEQQKQHPQK